jgi:hypothetical protein
LEVTARELEFSNVVRGTHLVLSETMRRSETFPQCFNIISACIISERALCRLIISSWIRTDAKNDRE